MALDLTWPERLVCQIKESNFWPDSCEETCFATKASSVLVSASESDEISSGRPKSTDTEARTPGDIAGQSILNSKNVAANTVKHGRTVCHLKAFEETDCCLFGVGMIPMLIH